MSSQALKNLETRLKDIDQLLAAHTALTKFKKAENAAKSASKGLSAVAAVVTALVTKPGKGKPAQVAALNRAAFVLLTAHFQGFVDDLHKEAAKKLLSGTVKDVDRVVKLSKPRNANPHIDVIEKMFSGLGVFDVMDGIKWKNCSTKTVKTRLTNYIEIRNKIAHGGQESIRKKKVQEYKNYLQLLAVKLDGSVSASAKKHFGKVPW